MRLRDLAVVAISLVASIFVWYQEGVINIRPSFYVAFHENDAAYYEGPKPIVTDFNDDGYPELIYAPTRDYISIVPTWRIRRSYHDSFIRLDQTKGIQLYGKIIGMAAGYLELPPNSTLYAQRRGKAVKKHKRRQSLAVVTDDYRLTVYRCDEQGGIFEMWSRGLLPPLQATMIPFHASVHVMPYRLYTDDQGMIVVSVKVPGSGGVGEVMMHVAVSGQDGTIRWRHKADPFPAMLDRSKDYKDTSKLRFTEEDMNEHAKELGWTHFREAVIAALPHSWSHTWNNELELHNFYSEKTRKKHKAARQPGKKRSRGARYKTRRFEDPTADDFGQLGERFTSARRHGGRYDEEETPNVIVSHTEEGMQVVHLFTGRVITTLGPLNKNSMYHDLDDDYHIDEVRVRFAPTQNVFDRHGVDQLQLCHGSVVSGVPFSAHTVYNVTICDTEGFFPALQVLAQYLHGDDARDHPSRDPLALIGSRPLSNKDIMAVTPIAVQHQLPKGNGIYKVSRDAVFMVDTGLVTAINPVQKRVMWRADTEAFFAHRDVESAGTAGGPLHSLAEKLARTPAHFPHLATYHFHNRHQTEVHSERVWHRGNDAIVLAIGDTTMVALNSKTGAREATVPLDTPPVAPAIIADFNGDGINDILITSRKGIYGFIVSHRTSGSLVTMLLLLMVLLLALLYAAQSMAARLDVETSDDLSSGGALGSFPPPPSRPVKVKRSTD